MSGRNNKVAEVGAWVLEHGHRTLLAISGGRFPKRVARMQTVELHTTGRRSGRRHSTMLTAPIAEPGRVVLVASKGGHDRHPDWYLNLAAQPRVEITIDGSTRTAQARTADPQEKADLWPRIVQVYRGYAQYQTRTERDIPVVVCDFTD
jgi:deazaflavin-dependent oxidoreductase (nitroreductase family)